MHLPRDTYKQLVTLVELWWRRQQGFEISWELTSFPCKICGNFLPLIFCQSFCVVGKCVHFHHRNKNNKLHKHNTKNIYGVLYSRDIKKEEKERAEHKTNCAMKFLRRRLLSLNFSAHEFRMCHSAEYWDVTAVARDIIDDLLRHNVDFLCE